VGEGQQQQPPSLSGEQCGEGNVVEQPNDTNNNNNSQQQQNHHRWSELGKGPAPSVLRNKETRKARIVQRRENAAGGQGTKLLLNTRLEQGFETN
jgi:hypothetical protein